MQIDGYSGRISRSTQPLRVVRSPGPPVRRSGSVTLVAVVGFLTVTLAFLLGPLGIALGGPLLVAVLSLVFGGQVFVWGAVVLSTATMPAVVPASMGLLGVQVRLHEPLLVAAAVWACATREIRVCRVSGSAILTALLAVGVVLGLATGNTASGIAYDTRNVVGMVLAAIIGARIAISTVHCRTFLAVLAGVMWWSAAITVAASLGAVQVNGRVEDSVLWIGGQPVGEGGVRLMTAATHPALAVLTAGLAVVVTGKVRIRSLLAVALPAALITFMSSSRNSLIAIGVALIVSLVASRDSRALAHFLRLCALLLLTTALLLLVVHVGSPRHFEELMGQGEAFVRRVLLGVRGEVLGADVSVLYRLEESRYLLAAAADSPIVGHGFGYVYKPDLGLLGEFDGGDGRLYAHNLYLWLMAKVGALGLVAFILVAIPAPARGLRSTHASTVGGSASLLGLLAVSVVAPMPLGSSSALVFGGLLGFVRSRVALSSPVGRGNGVSGGRGK